MGMDLLGRKRGSFDVNWGGWAPLVKFIWMFAANEAAPCRDWESNDLPGLDAEQTAKLVAKLKAARDRGAVANFIAIHNKKREVFAPPAFPDEGEGFAQAFPIILDNFIDFAEASGGFASMETIAMEHPERIEVVHITWPEFISDDEIPF